MRKFIISLLSALVLTGSAQTINSGKWNIVFDSATKTININNDGQTIVANAWAEANCAFGDGELAVVKSTDATDVIHTETNVSDCFGTGVQHLFKYTFADGSEMLQTIAFYDGLDYLVCRLSVLKNGTKAKSNRLSPLKSETTVAFLPNNRYNFQIFVPWDNDGFITYANGKLSYNDMYSFNVTSIHNTKSRYGVVAGALDHDLWKNAIHVNPSKNYQVDEFELISGYTDEHTHDSLLTTGTIQPHGTVCGDTVRSARWMLGCFDDWRNGLETFGDACNKVAPRLEWEGGSPVGWSSWGVMETKVSLQGVLDVGNFLRDNLREHGFHDKKGAITLSLDAWWNDNLTVDQVKQFVQYCEENNMVPGLYYGQFCYFGWSMESLNKSVPGTNYRYKFKDIVLKQNGQYKIVDGAFCLDPTHPATQMYIKYDCERFKSWGVKYLKCDFMSNGAIEADSWYDPECYTGVQAYNIGMKYFRECIGDDVYVLQSISPTFPYQYAHGRRISCDAWGEMGHTQYVMNNSSYGWWINKLYQSNDPDHLVMKGHRDDGTLTGYDTDGINRARLTSGLVTGAFILGDNFSDNVERGHPELSRQQALNLLTNPEINEIPRTCQAFRPLEGDEAGTKQEEFMICENDKYIYLAIFNYVGTKAKTGTVKYARMGIDASDVVEVKELWANDTAVTLSETGFAYSVPTRDACIYRLTKKNTSDGIEETTNADDIVNIDRKGNAINVSCASQTIKAVEVYDVCGKLIGANHTSGHSISTNLPAATGLVIVKATTSSGDVCVAKIVR